MHPISFRPIYKKRVWGGRELEHTYNRTLPDEALYGESWELSDRPDDQSIVDGGKYDGVTLNTLWTKHRQEIFGSNLPDTERFPLLFKILDCRSDLSVQVHPPEASAKQFGGEPKTEMWYIAGVAPESKLYVGIKKGTSKEEFKQAIDDGTVAEKIHTIYPKVGESMHLNSGRLHSIGAGLLIYEIQQNSDTTYRVFDWNRADLDGKPRELHIEQSMACIDFSDTEPRMSSLRNTISDCPHFKVQKQEVKTGETFTQQNNKKFAVITVVKGRLTDAKGRTYIPGDFFLLPAQSTTLTCSESALYLESTTPD